MLICIRRSKLGNSSFPEPRLTEYSYKASKSKQNLCLIVSRCLTLCTCNYVFRNTLSMVLTTFYRTSYKTLIKYSQAVKELTCASTIDVKMAHALTNGLTTAVSVHQVTRAHIVTNSRLLLSTMMTTMGLDFRHPRP